MKKILLSIMISVLLVSLMGFVISAPEGVPTGTIASVEKASEVLTGVSDAAGAQGSNGSGNENGTQEMTQEREQIREGSYKTSEGKQIQIQTRENNQMELQSGGLKAQTNMQLMNEGEDSQIQIKATLSNGRNAEIKVMPDAASQTALEKLKLKNCVEEAGCTIELKEVGKGDGIKPAYEIKTSRQSRVLGLFKANMDVEAQVDAETGELIKTKKPWWAFLASEPQEE